MLSHVMVESRKLHYKKYVIFRYLACLCYMSKTMLKHLKKKHVGIIKMTKLDCPELVSNKFRSKCL